MSVTHSTSSCRIAVTMGDPCGVGPEIIVKALAASHGREDHRIVVIGVPGALERAVDVVGGASLRLRRLDSIRELDTLDSFDVLPVISVADLSPDDLVYGHPTRATGGAVIAAIEKAVQLVQSGTVDAMCTCPIHKANLQRHGFPFPGHTEFLQTLTSSPDVVMMLAGPRLRVSLVTIHEPLAAVSRLLSVEAVRRTIEITWQALRRDFGLPSPRVAVAGLNPHSGEGGRFGMEDREIIEPAINELRRTGLDISGPHVPDAVFRQAYEGEFDAVVAMYHDQGLIPLKLVHFHDGVNVSLGLPIIRTSVDHGTAYDLAGTGKAHAGSLAAALQTAALMARNRNVLAKTA